MRVKGVGLVGSSYGIVQVDGFNVMVHVRLVVCKVVLLL